MALKRPAAYNACMRDDPPTPPLPPEREAYEPFPEQIPWDTPISELSNWWLLLTCQCMGSGHSAYPLRLMAARVGWDMTLRMVVPRLRCEKCGERPAEIWFVDDAAGDTGRFGAKTKRLRLA